MEHEGRGTGRATGTGRGGRGAGPSRHHAHEAHSEDGDASHSQDAAARGGRGGARGTPFRPRPGSAGRAAHAVGAAGGPGPAYTASESGAGAAFASPTPFEGRSGHADYAGSPFRGGRGAAGGGRGGGGGRGAAARGGAAAHTPRTPGIYSAVPHASPSAAYTPTPAHARGSPAGRGYGAAQSQQRAQGPPAQGPGAPFVSPGYTPPPSAYRPGAQQAQGHGYGQGQGQAHGGRSHGAIFAEHLHREDALAGLREGRLVVGYLRINARRPRQEAYVPVAGACVRACVCNIVLLKTIDICGHAVQRVGL